MIRLVYVPHKHEGPELKTLVKHGISVVPNVPWPAEKGKGVDPAFALRLVQAYPQIQGADAESRRLLEKLAKEAEEAAQAEKGDQQ